MNRCSLLAAILLLGLSGPALAQDTQDTPSAVADGGFPEVRFGVVSFLQYSAELHEADGYNAFDITRGYFNIEARLSDRVRVRFTPDVRPTTDASLNRNLAFRMEYASLDAQVTDNVAIMFGLHDTPWLTQEEKVNRYRVLGPFFAERMGLIPGPTDLGASVRVSRGRLDYHAGVYNGEGYGRAEADKYKSLEGRVSYRPFAEDGPYSSVRISGFYQYGWYARDRPRNVAIIMGTYETPRIVATAQYLSATDNPFIARDVERRGLSFFGEVRQGTTGWAGVGSLDMFDPDASSETDSRRRFQIGGARWFDAGRGRFGCMVTLEQVTGGFDYALIQRRLLAQTHIEF
jgi:hypothetical protein